MLDLIRDSECELTTGNRRRALLAIVGLLLVAHVIKASFLALTGAAPLYRDALGYWEMAVEASGGDWFLTGGASATRTPLYPWFLAVHHLFFASYAITAAAAVQQFLAAFSGCVAAWICWRVTRSYPATIIALMISLASISRSLIAHYLWSDNLLTLMLTLTLALCVEWWARARNTPTTLSSVTWVAGLGVAAGLCALIRPSAQFLFLVLGAAVAFGLYLRPRHGAGSARLRPIAVQLLALSLGAAVVVGPWMARNQSLFDEAFLVKFSGRSFWLSCFDPHSANLPFGEGPAMSRVLAIADGPGVNRRETWDIYAKLTQSGLSEIESDEMMLAATRETLRAQPVAFAISTASQWIEFWTYPWPAQRWRTDNPLIVSEGTYLDQNPWRVEALVPVYERVLNRIRGPREWMFEVAALVTLASLCLLGAQRDLRSLALFFFAILIYFATVTSVAAYPFYRYRSILEPTMIATVTVALGSLGRLKSRTVT